MRVLCRKLAFFLTLAFLVPAFGWTLDRTAETQIAFARARHLKRGINLSHWFSQSANDYSPHHTDTETDADDIALIARMGFDNVRLSIDATPLEQSPLGKDGLNSLAESSAVAQQQDYGSDSPRHTDHGDGRATPVVDHRFPGLRQNVLQHGKINSQQTSVCCLRSVLDRGAWLARRVWQTLADPSNQRIVKSQ